MISSIWTDPGFSRLFLAAHSVLPVDPARFPTEDAVGPIFLDPQPTRKDDAWMVIMYDYPLCVISPWRATVMPFVSRQKLVVGLTDLLGAGVV